MTGWQLASDSFGQVLVGFNQLVGLTFTMFAGFDQLRVRGLTISGGGFDRIWARLDSVVGSASIGFGLTMSGTGFHTVGFDHKSGLRWARHLGWVRAESDPFCVMLVSVNHR